MRLAAERKNKQTNKQTKEALTSLGVGANQCFWRLLGHGGEGSGLLLLLCGGGLAANQGLMGHLDGLVILGRLHHLGGSPNHGPWGFLPGPRR